MNIIAAFKLRRARQVAEGLGRESQRKAAQEYLDAYEAYEENAYDKGSSKAYDRRRHDAHMKLAATLGVSREAATRTLFGKGE